MLKSLNLENYRCFDLHEVEFKPISIVVGPNNAGKSTLVEALRLVSLITNRFKNLTYKNIPSWTDFPLLYKGISPSIEGLELNLSTIFYAYSEPPALIKATFTNGEKITICLGPEEKIFTIIESSNQCVSSKAQANKTNIPNVVALPQIGPLAYEEDILLPDYIRRSAFSYLASLHFRNQLNLFYDYFDEFKELAENSWPGLSIQNLEGQGGSPGDPLSLFVRDKNFVAEVSCMGHGLQMWLQTIWFLARTKEDSTVILDEPDVYMHADLQRKLIRLIRDKYKQLIIATHSIEIMSEVDADQILVVERKKRKSNFTTSLPAVQRFIDNIGGVQNIQLARLWSSKKCLLIEGKDISILKIIQNKLFPNSLEPFDTIPNLSIGGWGGWNYAIGSSMVLKNAVGEKIVTYCILDSDFHTPAQIKKRKDKANEHDVQLHIWKRKEIENYLIIPEAIQRCIANRVDESKTPPSKDVIKHKIDNLIKNYKDDVLDAIANEFLSQDKKGGLAKANRTARKIVSEHWKSEDGRYSIVSGKKLLSELSNWSNKRYEVSFGINAITQEVKTNEVPTEMKTIISKIESKKRF